VDLRTGRLFHRSPVGPAQVRRVIIRILPAAGLGSRACLKLRFSLFTDAGITVGLVRPSSAVEYSCNLIDDIDRAFHAASEGVSQ